MASRFNQNKHQKYINLLNDLKTVIENDQKQCLTVNETPEKIASNIQELKRIKDRIRDCIASIEDGDEE